MGRGWTSPHKAGEQESQRQAWLERRHVWAKCSLRERAWRGCKGDVTRRTEIGRNPPLWWSSGESRVHYLQETAEGAREAGRTWRGLKRPNHAGPGALCWTSSAAYTEEDESILPRWLSQVCPLGCIQNLARLSAMFPADNQILYLGQPVLRNIGYIFGFSF